MDTVSIPSAPAVVPPAEVADPRIYIGCPAYGRIDVPFVCSLITTLQSLPIVGDLQFFNGDSLVSRARNNVAHMFLQGKESRDANGNPIRVKHDWLLFLDTDLIFQPADVQLLYELAVKHGPSIYAGTYPLKKLRPQIVFNALQNCTVDADGVVPVREAGTGFMLIHRQVLLKMKAAYPQNNYTADNGDAGGAKEDRHDWFQVGVKEGRYLSEDYFFCEKWRDMGGMIRMQTKICANHIGSFVYPPNPAEVIEVAEIYKKAFAAKGQPVAAAA